MSLVTTLKSLTVCALLAGTPAAFGQITAKIETADPSFDNLQSPEIGGNTGKKSWKPKDWLEAEVKITVDLADKKKKTLDSLTVSWFVAVEDPGKGKQYLLLEKKISHVNVPEGEDVYCSVYISPASLMALTGKSRATKNAVWGIGGEITAPGAKPVRFSSKGEVKKTPWWTSGKLQRSTKYPLLNKNETPFKILWWDRYAEIKDETR